MPNQNRGRDEMGEDCWYLSFHVLNGYIKTPLGNVQQGFFNEFFIQVLLIFFLLLFVG